MATLSRPLFRIAFRPKVEGTAHLPRGGFVISANHLSGFDVWAVSYALYPRQLRNMAKNQLFARPLLGPVVRGLGAFPAHGGDDGSGGAAAAAALAAAGEVVVIFPEVARRRPGREHRPRTGAARAALDASVPLIPAAIRGTDGWRRLRCWRIAIGAPVPLDDLRQRDPSSFAREATRRLWESIGRLESMLARGA